jgi:hypothetical protein
MSRIRGSLTGTTLVWTTAIAITLALPAAASDEETANTVADPDEAHIQAYLAASDLYPSATACGECHPTQYRQWSVSQHAYAQLSPVFNTMQGAIAVLTNGTLGDFCIRCHNQVGMNLGEPTFTAQADRHPTSREGISCVVCHRLNREYSKISGRFFLETGPVTSTIYGPTGNNTELDAAIEAGGLVTDPNKAGRKVHAQTEQFFQLTTGGFCGGCHDVVELNGFRLEDAFSEWKNSPAAKAGISCQDCHMGVEQGKIAIDRDDPEFERKNYAFGPAAKVGGRATADRKLTNHRFVGPDHSVVHPGLFPLNIEAIKEEFEKDDPTAEGMATIDEWLQFDWKAGWGTDDFEESEAADGEFPERWESPDDRYDARVIIDDNLVLLEEMRELQLELLRNGYVLGEIEPMTRQEAAWSAPGFLFLPGIWKSVSAMFGGGKSDLNFKVEVKSGQPGHNVPTGFDGERVVWLHVRVLDSAGKQVFVSGDLDPNGDVRDLHSVYVHNHELPLDTQLFNLQGKFVTTMVRGPEQEQVIAVPRSPGAARFLQPEFRSSALLGRHFGARKHRIGIEPNGHRWAKYRIKANELTGNAPYKAIIQLKAAMIPPNLVHEVGFLGYDYGMTPREVAEAVVAGHQIVWEREVDLGN